MANPGSQITGIASGFDTAAIIEKLMKAEKVPYDKLDVKKQTEQVKLQAYQAVNSMMLKFRTSISTLSSQKLWKSKAVSSTNDKSLTAVANEYAVNGSYSLKVAQLAASAQFRTKGFASSKTAFVKQADKDVAYKLGEINLNSAKSRVDTSAKLEQLNGGKGIYRGSVRVTDRANNSSIIDLSACDTMDDVVNALNASTGAQIKASLKEGRIHIEDNSGGVGTIRVQNVGAGTTATDLGIAGTSGAGETTLQGRNVYVLGNDMALNTLQDGLGVEEGTFYLRVSKGAEYYDVAVNVDECATVGDVIKRVNNEIEYRVVNQKNDPKSGGSWELLKDLRFGLSDDKTAFALNGTQAGATYQFYEDPDPNKMLDQTPATQLGLLGRNSVTTDNETITFGRVIGGTNSPMVKNLSGVNGYGIGSAGSSTLVSIPFNGNTLISALNSGKGVDISMPLQIRLFEGGGKVSDSEKLSRTFYDIVDTTALNTLVNDPTKTIGDLVIFLNKELAQYSADPANEAAGLTGMKFLIDENNGRLVIAGGQGGQKVEIMGTLANSLGLIRAGKTAVENTGDAETKAKVEAFYGLDGSTKAQISGNKTIEDKTTLRNLDVLHGLDMSDPDNQPTDQEIVDAIMAKLTGGNKFTVNLSGKFLTGWNDTTHQGIYADLDLRDVEVDLSGLTITADSKPSEFLDQINAAIQTSLSDAAEAAHGSPVDVSAPQLRIDTYAKGFQWANMDFTKNFSAAGTAAETLGVNKGIAAADVKTLPMDALGDFHFNPKTTGYLKELPFTAANANTIMLGNLNNGASLTFAGAETDVISIDLGEGKKVEVTMKELRDAINAEASLNTTLDKYVGILNKLVNDKLKALDPAADPADVPSLEFRVGNNRLEVANFKNADRLVISGAGADAAKTGIAAVNVAKLPDAGKAVELPPLKAAIVTQQAVTGLGDITLKLGSGSEVTLKTDGLTASSTLEELITKLNKELDAAATAAGGNPELAKVRFVVNDAGTGLAVTNESGQNLEFVNKKDANTIASDLGLIDAEGKGVKVETYSHFNGDSLARKYLSRATSLSSIMGGGAIGSITVTNAGGVSRIIDLSQEAKTVGDVLDAINSAYDFGVQAFINERGDGITLIEAYPAGSVPNPPPKGNISVADFEGGSLAKKLGIAGQGTRDNELGVSMLEGSMRTTIDVMSSDTLETLMYRISEKGYKTAIINDGSSTAPYRLTISSTNTGEASDFVIESGLDMFGFNQVARGKDSKVLFGDPNSGASPIMLSSSTNSNSNAILGLTLDLKATSSEYVTLTVGTDKEKAVEELKNMVQTYNDLNDLVSYLDAYDEETGEPGILFGDSSIRKLMDDINEMFYVVYNPNQEKLGAVDSNGKQQTWTWMDLGVSLSAKNSNADGTGNWYSSMDLDLDKLDEMVSKNWDVLYSMLAGQRDASNVNLGSNVRPTASFNGKAAEGFKVENAINGDINKSSWGINNGFMADGTIAQGQNEYTVYFQQPVTMSRMSIYHQGTDTALKNFTVEYLDANTGKWETLREINNNGVDANHLGMANPTTVSGIRIKATSTNASDGKFRLLDIQVFEDTGLAGKLNQVTTKLGDTKEGFLAERNEEVTKNITDITEQMTRLQERLDMKEENLWKRFTAMETALSKMQNQSSYFSSMISSLK